MAECRNCGGKTMVELGHRGVLAPFFLKRVMGVELGWQESPNGIKRAIRGLAGLAHQALGRIAAPVARVAMEVCAHCTFVQTALPFSGEAIGRLYADYRGDSYTAERIGYEPGYAAIAPYNGKSAVETEARATAVMKFLEGKVKPDGHFTILDYGGADGRYMPRFDAEKYVYEISSMEPVPGVTRIRSEAELGTYSLVQVAHVFEHVVHPLELARKVADRVAPGGHLYVEVPQDLPDEALAELSGGKSRRVLTVHEHINLYSVRSVEKLIEAAGLRVVGVEAMTLNLGWTTTRNLFGLGQRV